MEYWLFLQCITLTIKTVIQYLKEIEMKKILLIAISSILLFTQFSYARTVEVSVYGMTCAFCVDSLERKFSKMKSVSNVAVSLKLKQVRLETSANQPSIDTIKQTILDAGFTPTNVTIIAK